jgi:3-oxoacyl-[acyl-carrier-protein] synthase II
MKRRVVVTGLGIVSPLGCSLDTFWTRLTAGQSGIRRIQRFDPSEYRSQIAGEVVEFEAERYLDKKEVRRNDPFTHFGFAAARMAVEDSGLDFSAWEEPARERVGVVVGSGIGGLHIMQEMGVNLAHHGNKKFSPFMIPQMITDILAGQIAIHYGLTGPNFSLSSACATAAHSIGESTRMIQHGEAEVMVAGGAEGAINELGVGGFSKMHALSSHFNDQPTRASRPFDRARDGFVIAEGAAVLVLEELEHARRRGARIYGEVSGYGRTCDAFHITAPHDKGRGAARAMELALAEANLAPSGVGYINAHGTSTGLGDVAETRAIKAVFGDSAARQVAISSTKSMTGHALGAAAGFESVACLLALTRGVIPPTINLEDPDPECDLDYTPNTARELRFGACLNNSFGFGGHNACLCFRAV